MPSFTRQTENELKSGKMKLEGNHGPVTVFKADELSEEEIAKLEKEKNEDLDWQSILLYVIIV